MTPCPHTFLPSPVTDYSRCADCGTYHSDAARDPHTLYSADFWGNTHSSLAEQCFNTDLHTENGVSKARFILDRIESERGAALEVGCAPGRLLFWLKWAARFKHVIGIDPGDPDAIRKLACDGGEVFRGFFPEAVEGWETGRFDYLAALDVFEHCPEPEAFLREAALQLAPGGQLFLMLPLADGLAPDSRMFSAVEHVWLHSRRNLGALLVAAGFEKVTWDCWAVGHDTVSARKA